MVMSLGFNDNQTKLYRRNGNGHGHVSKYSERAICDGELYRTRVVVRKRVSNETIILHWSKCE